MKTEKISTGSYDLNTWLYGGYEKDIITMIAGPPGCGKTNFVILASCSQAKKGKKVIFVDTEGGFSVERVKQIVGEEKSGYTDCCRLQPDLCLDKYRDTIFMRGKKGNLVVWENY